MMINKTEQICLDILSKRKQNIRFTINMTKAKFTLLRVQNLINCAVTSRLRADDKELTHKSQETFKHTDRNTVESICDSWSGI